MAGRIAYYGNTVTNGLVLSLDAAKRDSYPGSGTAWRDISGNGYSATLNNVSYNTDNQGNFAWDNNLDSITFSTSLGLTYSSATVSFWMRTTDTRFVVYSRGSGGPYLGAVWLGGNGNGAWYHSGVGSPTAYTNGIVSSGPNYNGTWNYYTFTNCNFSANSDWNSNTVLFYYAGGWEFETGSLATFTIYSRSLSQQEILQNYNAQKSRYGL